MSFFALPKFWEHRSYYHNRVWFWFLNIWVTTWRVQFAEEVFCFTTLTILKEKNFVRENTFTKEKYFPFLWRKLFLRYTAHPFQSPMQFLVFFCWFLIWWESTWEIKEMRFSISKWKYKLTQKQVIPANKTVRFFENYFYATKYVFKFYFHNSLEI